MYKKCILLFFILLILTSCGHSEENITFSKIENVEVTVIEFKDNSVFINDKEVSEDNTLPIYTANDIVYYEDNQDFTYGKGYGDDLHSKEEADANIVVHINQSGTYELKGRLEKGQIAIDLGKEAKNNPEAVVNLILNNVNITCDVAPAIIFYNVYECGSDDRENASMNIDTFNAGANIIIADDSINSINGSYVARIYRPESVVLNEEGNKVIQEKKLHKYDAAFYSKMSMNIWAEKKGTGVLNIIGENEGLDTEMHLTINGGTINIESVNDGINVNEDDISVLTVNAGVLNINVSGNNHEGDGIDSNGWLVINGGRIISQSCDIGTDSGIDGNNGTYINGGTVVAAGRAIKNIYTENQNFIIFNFHEGFNKGNYKISKPTGKVIIEFHIDKSLNTLLVTSDKLDNGDYVLYCDGIPIIESFTIKKGENYINV